MVATAATIVTAAAKKSGIQRLGQALDASDTNDALSDLGDMLAQWSELRWMVWHELEFAFVSTGQTTPYSVGPGGQFNMNPRPSKIEFAFLRQLQGPGSFVSGLPVDYPLEVIPSAEEYAVISLKQLLSFPKYVFLDTAFPVANLKIYPYPNAGIYEIHILVKDTFPVSITAPTSFANYPPMTIPAMKFNLARRLRQAYGKGKTPDVELNLLAQESLDIVKNAQTQIPELRVPRVLVYPTRYNILSDQLY
jgi:hypothetical protein